MKGALTLFLCLTLSVVFAQTPSGIGSHTYDKFETPKFCGTSCHTTFYVQWKQSMMSQAYTHHWDEIEYFELAVPHAEKDQKVAEVKAGCNGCHSPLALMDGKVFPPPAPKENTRANEGVSCEVCHSITGFTGDTPFNFNYVVEPGKTKFSTRLSGVESPAHSIKANPLLKTGDFCGICHNEKSPYDVWVKSTHLEWKAGPYYTQGVQCQDCHMPKGEMKFAAMGNTYPDTRLHLFHGAHDPGKVRGTVEIRINPDIEELEPGEPINFTIALFNGKAGHKFPSGSVEDRILWLNVEVTGSDGTVYHLPVNKKGFPGEEYTIAADVLAYQDMGIPKNIPDFKGIQRDGVPVGDRIFRMPYFDNQGRMTIQQWNTASLGTDYRIGPRETKVETYTFNVPANAKPGTYTIKAILNYALLVKPVGDFLNVPAEETTPIEVNQQFASFTVLP